MVLVVAVLVVVVEKELKVVEKKDMGVATRTGRRSRRIMLGRSGAGLGLGLGNVQYFCC